jgi:ribulose-5-phosphate 4-epimerase/fuculose-1-phosphate aldolase
MAAWTIILINESLTIITGEENMGEFESVKLQVLDACRALVTSGYLIATGGNVSVRATEQTAFAITPSNFDYMQMSLKDVCVLDFDLILLEGEHKPSMESGMHAGIYQARADVNAVVHTHQVYASALALINAPIPALFDEQVLFLGRPVEIIPYAPSGSNLLRDTVPKAIQSHHNAYIIQNHGVLGFGQDVQRAIQNVKVLEKCALAYLLALCTDKEVSSIPTEIREMMFARLRADQQKLVSEGGNA